MKKNDSESRIVRQLFASVPAASLIGIAFVVVACGSPFASDLTTIDEMPFDKDNPHKDRPANIEISTPQVYSRESLINDRRDEERYLKTLLEQSTTIPFPAELARDLSSISALALNLGLSFNPAKALEFDAAREQLDLRSERDQLALRQEIDDLEARSELRQLERDIDQTRLEIELERLRAELAAVRAGSPPPTNSNADTSGDGDETSSGDAEGDSSDDGSLPTVTPPPDRLNEIEERIDSVLDRLATRTAQARRVDAPPDPRADFRARQAYRQDLRAALAEARLDDGHDRDGYTLYRLQFQATVAPGEHKRKWGVSELEIKPPAPEVMDYFPSLYRTWLGHATYRLNQAESMAQKGRIPNPLFRSLAAAGAFTVGNIYYHPNRKPGQILDICESVRSNAEAKLKGCQSFALAMPAAHVFREHSLTYAVKGAALQMFADRAIRELANKPITSSPLELEKIANGSKKGAYCSRRFLEAPCPSDLRLDESILSIAELGVLLEEAAPMRSEDKNEEESSPITDLDAYKRYEVWIDQGGEPDHPPAVEDQRELITAVLSLASQFTVNDWLKIWPAEDSLDFAIRILESSRALSASIQGLTSLTRLTDIQEERLDWLLRWLTETTDAARRYVEFLFEHNSCTEWGENPQENDIDRSKALLKRWEHEEYGTTIPFEFFRALAERPTECRDLYPDYTWDESCELKGSSTVHAVSPLQLEQRVSTIASATRALQIAASLQQTFSGGGGGAGLGGSFSKGATGQVETIERLPLVVAFSSQTQPKPPCSEQANQEGSSTSEKQPAGEDCVEENEIQEEKDVREDPPTSAEPESQAPASSEPERMGIFGWVFGPRALLDPKEGRVYLEHTLANYTLTADLVVPVWWPRVEMDVRSGWVGHWQAKDESDLGLLRVDSERSLRKDLPKKRADLDSLTAVLAREFLGAPIRDTEIYAVYPERFSVCDGKVRLQIYGSNIWRSSKVQLAGLPPVDGSIRVLPDMEGVAATFDLKDLPKGPQLRRPDVTVWTQSGFDTWRLDLDDNFDAQGNCVTQAPASAGLVARVTPSTLPRCERDVSLLVETVGERIDQALLGTVAAENVEELNPPAQGNALTLLTFAAPNDGNVGLDTWPLTLVTRSGAVLRSSVTAKGDACKPSPRKPRLRSVSPATVSRCAETVTLAIDTDGFTLAHAYLGTRESASIEPVPSSGGPRGYLLTFDQPAAVNQALSTWPLTLVTDKGQVLTGTVAVEGKASDCGDEGAPSSPPEPALEVALAGPLNVCIPQESLTVVGPGADTVTAGELLGVQASSVIHHSKTAAVLAFDLPTFDDPKAVEANTTLRLTVGGKVIEIKVDLRCHP